MTTGRVPKPGRRLVIVGLAVCLVTVAAGVGLLTGGGGPRRATIQVVSVPPGAQVRIDGTTLNKVTPLELTDVDAQVSHHVRVSMHGFDVWESDVKFETSGGTFVRLQAVLVPTVGTLHLSSVPEGAEAIVNGRIRGITPTIVNDLPPNQDVSVELRLRGFVVARKTFPWAGKRKLEVTIALEKAN
jgi:hypothetical protein